MLERDAIAAFPGFFPQARLICSARVGFSSFMLFLEIPPDIVALANAAHMFRMQSRERLAMKLPSQVAAACDIHVGYAYVDSQPAGDMDSVLLRAYLHAQRLGARPRDVASPPLHKEFQCIVERGKVTTLYQPIVDFETSQVMGWEAFSRGPENTFFSSPQMLFQLAREAGATFRLEKLCREKALTGLGQVGSNQRLFLNNHSDEIADPNFTPGLLLEEIEAYGLKPHNIVLEFAERQGFKDMNLFFRDIERFRAKGFAIAIDDVGSGDSSLRNITLIRPDFIKFDISLVEGIDTNPYHRSMVETLLFLAQRIGARTIAVGIETETALSSLVSMGVNAGQGNCLGVPGYKPASPCVAIPCKTGFTQADGQSWKCSAPIRELVMPCPTTSENATVREIKEQLADKPAQTSMVVVRNGRPCGLLMQYNTDRHLSTQFGMSLYYNREVARIMDPAPLIVEGDLPIEDVAALAMVRESTKVYDDIIVVDKEKLLGVVSVQRMLDQLTQTQVELAKGANPLSGLPGNVSIEREIERRLKGCHPTAMAYIDLDNFKVYNDVYGFERGDRIILLTADLLREAVKLCGGEGDFLGHIGGDDFLVMADPARVVDICNHIMHHFALRSKELYSPEDAARGYLVGKGRDGQTGRFPLTSLSIAVIDCPMDACFSMELLSNRTAAVKKHAKSVEGNSLVREPLLAATAA
uniref:Putative response regulator n=1 Tax=Megalodesulfovibrio gigas TaxID=879 RepID=Q9KJJ0_MEGGA|nr:putative response regulator [Megalodesulfovibrio gigas]